MKNVFDALTLFHYHFQDASVPPPYHRSYTIRADSNQVQIWVYCYGDTLASEVYPLPDSALQRVGGALLKNGIAQHKKKKTLKGCTGGVGHEIMYASTINSTTFSANRYVCGGGYEGDLKGDVNQFLEDIAFLTPALDSLIKSTK
ncbi:MAG: hypothetical protein ACRBFS_25965 [Aureispira sp.]